MWLASQAKRGETANLIATNEVVYLPVSTTFPQEILENCIWFCTDLSRMLDDNFLAQWQIHNKFSLILTFFPRVDKQSRKLVELATCFMFWLLTERKKKCNLEFSTCFPCSVIWYGYNFVNSVVRNAFNALRSGMVLRQ